MNARHRLRRQQRRALDTLLILLIEAGRDVSDVILISSGNGRMAAAYRRGAGPGRLVGSIAPAAGTDEWGNPYQAGNTVYPEPSDSGQPVTWKITTYLRGVLFRLDREGGQ